MKVLHVLKTSDGADFAARQVSELVKSGVHIDVVLPKEDGAALPLWRETGALLHFVDLDFPVRKPWLLFSRLKAARGLVKTLRPDLIHSHFFGPTLVLRYALGKNHPIPRLFQVPGPLHLENLFFRKWELSSAGAADWWIASSHYIESLYLKAGVLRERVFQSYYGIETGRTRELRSFKLHDALGIPRSQHIVGNISYMYPPKFYLGQTVGLKCHEDLIDALADITAQRDDVAGVLIGGAWGGAKQYEASLKRRALSKAHGRIYMPGFLSREFIAGAWADMDIAVHVPLSENCGGVVEPLLAGVPVIASAVGGLPEVIEDGVTGNLVPPRSPKKLSATIAKVLGDLTSARSRAEQGCLRIKTQFDLVTTSGEILLFYKRLVSAKA